MPLARDALLSRIALFIDQSYSKLMAEVKKLDLDDSAHVLDEEDEETLACIDEGLRDAELGRTVPIEEVRRLLPQWITDSSSRKER